MSYEDFIVAKSQLGGGSGIAAEVMPDGLFHFQQDLVEWALWQGRAALFEDCGLGKTIQHLTWAENVCRHTGKPVLVLTPLAVAEQTVREGAKFGIEVVRSKNGAIGGPIVVTNYDRLHYFDPSQFSGVVCDESSILKNFDGATRNAVTQFMRKTPYRLLCTATAAPNDYTELGTSSEALGMLGAVDMLHRFFVNDRNNNNGRRMYGEQPEWRFKGHAEGMFWRWVVSWARALRRPSDLGYEDGGFELPPLTEERHLVDVSAPNTERLFDVPATNLHDQRRERRRSLEDRVARAAELAATDDPVIVWCHLNDEADALEREIPDAVQVSGKDSDDAKEEKFLAFVDGGVRALVCKPKIGAWGLNFQHCAHVVTFPSHSYEQYYQAVRRCWRFGQERPVQVDIVLTEGDLRVMQNLSRKAEAAAVMFENLVALMRDAVTITPDTYSHTETEVPQWLTSQR